jgi:hypothetical protein
VIATVVHTGAHAGKRARLRELRGADELRAAESGVIALLRELLEPVGHNDLHREALGDLTVSDRDRVLAELYVAAFGDAVACRWACEKCREPFEIELSMRALSASALAGGTTQCVREPDGHYATPAGTRFRLPTLDDQQHLSGLPQERVQSALVERCVERVCADEDVDTLMAEVGPLLDLDLSASCPACDAAQSVPFEIQQFLHGVMMRERRWLTREVHRLATAYGWGLSEILELPRSLRREYVALVEAEGMGRRRHA